ncbi:hypothetical protein BHF68_07885 [Desulfuribacillus alkaliarsenatis]|uniref:Serine aminopeptidase S33 domain-containing protein n=2 Tax=Desulfuribacillus alkaliarsenatis TaxID=766136 RepID=A0A1E5G184_9FIRM|nr:hypothetical protein BHF68_07885 [Desulfuribacillus alkaliarsenatis]
MQLTVRDGQKLHMNIWDDVEQPRAIILILHGMAEHSTRYENFANYLNHHKYMVVAYDHRGHGQTAGSVEQLGYIGRDGFNKIVDDVYDVLYWAKQTYRFPVFLFAHSFGSFVAQEFLLRHVHQLAGVMLCGSAARNGLDVQAGMLLAKLEMRLFGDKKKSRLLDTLSFAGYNRKIENPTSRFDWLTTDKSQVKRYEEDPFCGTTFTTGFYAYFFEGLTRLYDPNRLQTIPKSLPMFILAGKDDPVGGYGFMVEKLYHMYQPYLRDLKMKLYDDMRHELINERHRGRVYADITNWLQSKL